MRVILTVNNQPADLEAGYALRLIEQGRAIALRKQVAEDEKQVGEILAERTEFKTQGITPPTPPVRGGKEDEIARGGKEDEAAREDKNTPLPPSKEGARDEASEEGADIASEEVTAEEWVEGKVPGEGNKRQRGKKSPKKAGEGNVAG